MEANPLAHERNFEDAISLAARAARVLRAPLSFAVPLGGAYQLAVSFEKAGQSENLAATHETPLGERVAVGAALRKIAWFLQAPDPKPHQLTVVFKEPEKAEVLASDNDTPHYERKHLSDTLRALARLIEASDAERERMTRQPPPPGPT